MKVKKINNIIIVLTIMAFWGCERRANVTYVNTNESGEIEFDVTEALENEPVLYLDDMIDSIKIIPLETISPSLLSYTIDLIVSPQNIFMLDISHVIIFNSRGQWIKTLNKGAGPDEIGAPRAMSYDEKNNCLYIFDALGFKIMKFSPDGDLLSSNTIKRKPIRDIAVFDTLMLIAHHEIGNIFAVSACDTIGIADKTFVFGSDQYDVLSQKYIIPYNGGFNIKKLFDNKIYYLKDTVIKAKYSLKYPMMNIDYSQYKSLAELEKCIPDGKYLFSGAYTETQDYLLTGYRMSGLKVKVLFTNKNTGKSFGFNWKQGSVVSFFVTKTTVNNKNNWFVGIIKPEHFVSQDIPEEYRWDGSNPNNLISDEDMAKLKAVKPDDNPIIVLFKLKDDI